MTARDLFRKGRDRLGIHGVRVDADARQPELDAERAEHGVLRGGAEVDEHLAETAAGSFLLIDCRLQLIFGNELALEKHGAKRRPRRRRVWRNPPGGSGRQHRLAPCVGRIIESQCHKRVVSPRAIVLPTDAADGNLRSVCTLPRTRPSQRRPACGRLCRCGAGRHARTVVAVESSDTVFHADTARGRFMRRS